MVDEFQTNLMRVIAAQQYLLIGLQLAREMWGKSYTALSLTEKDAVDRVAMGMIGSNYRALTAEMLATSPDWAVAPAGSA